LKVYGLTPGLTGQGHWHVHRLPVNGGRMPLGEFHSLGHWQACKKVAVSRP